MDIIQLSKNNFAKEVLEAEGIVIVDFYAPSCEPCRNLLPQIEELAEELKDMPGIKICKLNVEGAKELTRTYRVLMIPTVLRFEQGRLIRSSINPVTKERIKEELHIA